MFPFLDLPAEIRALIIEQVLFTSRTPPDYPSHENRVRFNYMPYMAVRGQPYHELLPSHCTTNSLPLLLTSRQVNAETRAVLEINLQDSETYHLDISVLDDDDVFPTWLCVPQLTTRVHKLYVDVRLFGNIISPRVSCRQGGDGGHTRYEWDFLALLVRFLKRGPVGERKAAREQKPAISDREIKIYTLILDFSSGEDKAQRGEFPPSDIEYRDWLEYRRGWSSRPTWHGLRLEEYNTRPEWLANLLVNEIDMILDLSYHRASSAPLLYARLGHIRMLVDGTPFREIDLGRRLDELKYGEQREDLPEWVVDL